MKTKLATLLSLSVLATGYADDNQCNPCTPCDPCCVCDWGVGITADFLWWRAQGDQLDYGIVTQGSIDRSGTPDIEILTETWLEYTPRWNPGARVALEKSICEGLGVFAEWTWYQTVDRESTTLLASGSEGEFLSFNSDFFGGVGGVVSESILAFDSGLIDARFLFLMNRVDFGFYKEFFACDSLLFRAYAAFTYAHFRENMELNGDFTNATTGFFELKDYKTKTKIDSYGIKIGAIGDWGFFPCFSLYTQASLTGLWGDFCLRRDFFESLGGTVNDRDLTLSFSFDRWQGRFVTQLQAALKYSTWFCGCYNIVGMLGWEHQVIFDQTNWLVRPGEVATLSNKPASNLYIQGLVARLGFFF